MAPYRLGSFIFHFLVRLRVGSAQGYREAVKARPSGPPEPAPGAPPTPGAKAARRGQQGTPARSVPTIRGAGPMHIMTGETDPARSACGRRF